MPGTKVQGMTLEHGAIPAVVAELESLTLPEDGPVTAEDTVIADDAERHSSTGVESAGEVSGEILFSPATHAALIALQASHDKTPWVINYPSGAKHTFTGASFKMGLTAAVKGFFRAPFSIQKDGKMVFVPAP